MGKQSPAVRWCPAWAIAALFALSAAPVSAQKPGQILFITTPDGWQDGRPVVVPPGQSLHVEGWVTDPDGVKQVLVNGSPAHLVPDSSGIFRFDTDIPGATRAQEVVIRVESRVSDPYSKTFGMTVTGALPGDAAAPASPTAQASAAPPEPKEQAEAGSSPKPAVPEPSTPPGPSTAPTLPHLPGNPWKPFTFRGLGYAALAAGGLYLSTKQSTSTSEVCSGPPSNYDCVNHRVTAKPQATLGAGLAGGAVVVGIVDALLTAHRASRTQADATRQGLLTPTNPGIGLGAPTLESSGSRERFGLLHLTF